MALTGRHAKDQRRSLRVLFFALAKVAWVIKTTLETRSLTIARLFLLTKRVPSGHAGSIHLPFGQLRFVDATSLFGLYAEIFLQRVYELTGLGDAPYIVDCGANIGLSTIWFTQRYPHATITAFEADPAIADVLEDNIRTLKLQSVEVVRAAVGDVTGPVTFIADGVDAGYVNAGSGITVDSIRLSDRLCKPVDLLKVDIEGSEYGLVKDLCASGKISLVKSIVCEVHGRNEVQGLTADLWAALSGAGFRITVRTASTAPRLPGPTEPTPFTAVHSGKFLLHLYAWRL